VGDISGDSVVATALLDRLLHHAVVIQIEGSSYRLREHADLLPENVRFKPEIRIGGRLAEPPLPHHGHTGPYRDGSTELGLGGRI
jgi:hypothetical protein